MESLLGIVLKGNIYIVQIGVSMSSRAWIVINALKSKLSERSANPRPMYAFLPASSTRTTKYREESNTASTDGLVTSYSALANTKIC